MLGPTLEVVVALDVEVSVRSLYRPTLEIVVGALVLGVGVRSHYGSSGGSSCGGKC